MMIKLAVGVDTKFVTKRKNFPVPLDVEIRSKINEKDKMSRKLNELKNFTINIWTVKQNVQCIISR